ncbi:hypothetical protein EMCRGX_G014690 [Ephydatia muelleri]
MLDIMSANVNVIAIALYLLLAFLLLAVLGFSLYAVLLAYVRWKYAHLPSPKTNSFFLGHAYELEQFKRRGNGENPPDEQYIQWAFEVGNVYVIFFHWRPFVVILNSAAIEAFNMSPLYKNSTNRFEHLFGARLVGNGLISLQSYEVWKPRRQLYESAFNASHLKGLIPNFCKRVDLFLKKLVPLADGETKVPLRKYMHDAAVDVISEVLFSSDFNTEWRGKPSTPRPGREQELNFLLGEAFRGIQMSYLYPFFKFFHPFEAQHFREVAKTLRTIGSNCIEARIKALDNSESVPLDILSHILRGATSDELADIESLVDDFIMFYLGGVETTANTLLFAVIQVHQHADVLERLRAEIQEVLGDKDDITAEDLDKLKYTEQVIEETMRIPGIIGGFMRECPAGGVTLSGYRIPSGTNMLFHTGAMCRMSQYIEDPYTFNPSRFDPANKRPSPYVYLPFGIGHHSCIAKHFAMMEAKLILSRLVQNFKVTFPDGYKLDLVERISKPLQHTHISN